MRWSHVMLALPSLGEIPPIELDKICKLTAGLRAELEIFHCIFDEDVAQPEHFATLGAQEGIHELIERCRQQLEIIAGRPRSRGIRVRTSVRWDYPTYEGIVRQVLRHRPDLLITGTTVNGHTGHLRLARTDFRLIETCPCPVLFIKTLRPYSDAVVAAAVDPALTHGKPAALDLEILDAASKVRDALPAKLLMFHARTAHEHQKRTNTAAKDAPDSQLLTLAERYGVASRRVHILQGHLAEALPRFAYQQMADIVVMGAAAHAWVRRALIGHTAERIFDALDCDVLVVKAPGFQSPVSRRSTHHERNSSAFLSRYFW